MKIQLLARRFFKAAIAAAFAGSITIGSAHDALATVAYSSGTYSQNFDSLTTSTASTAWTNDSTLPGWSLFRAPAPGTAITTYLGGNGSSNTGSFYSFGAASDSDRALGGLASGGAYFGSPASTAVAGWITVGLTNTSAQAINSVNVQYDGEEWRDGGFAQGSTPQTMALEYGFGTSFTAVTSWTSPGAAFNFTSPDVGATAGIQLDGNLAANRTANVGGTISSVNWTPGSTLWVRWIENNDLGNDHALAVDNFRLTAVPEPATWVMATAAALGMAMCYRRRVRA